MLRQQPLKDFVDAQLVERFFILLLDRLSSLFFTAL